MTQSEKQRFVDNIVDLVMRDVLKKEDMVEILKVCSAACSRRIAEIEEETRPENNVPQ